MKVTAIRALLAARAALEEAGLGHEGARDAPVDGWLPPNYMNGLGHALRQCPDGTLEWNLVLTGRPHLEYVAPWGADGDWDAAYDGGGEPADTDRLHASIAAVYEGLGLDVAGVSLGSFGDTDVCYVVSTPRPDWLEDYDPSNAQPSVDGPRLTGFAPSPHAMPDVRLRGPLPGYEVGGLPFLTRESVLALVEAASRSRFCDARFEVSRDGTETLVLRSGTNRDVRIPPTRVVNHWGDEVAAWRVTSWVAEVALTHSAVPFVVEGEARDSVPFATFDAQHGDAPWSPPPAPAP